MKSARGGGERFCFDGSFNTAPADTQIKQKSSRNEIRYDYSIGFDRR